MSKVIIHQLPNLQSIEENINEVRNNPSFIYEILGFGNEHPLQNHDLISIDSTLMIQSVEAQTVEEARCLVQNQNSKADFFEFDGFTFVVMNSRQFKSLSISAQQDFVNKFFDSLSLHTCEIKERSVYSLASLAALTVIEQSSIIDPGLSDIDFFDGRGNEANEISSITFEPTSSENTDFYVTSMEIELEPKLSVDVSESIVFDIDEQTSSSILEISDGSDLEDAGNAVVDDTELKRYDDIEYPFEEDIDADPYDNFDIL
jgi:hypothetical protein